MTWLSNIIAGSWWFTYLGLYVFSLIFISILIITALPEWSWNNFLFVFKPMALIYWFVCVPLAWILQGIAKYGKK
jgi:hypothetical protein